MIFTLEECDKFIAWIQNKIDELIKLNYSINCINELKMIQADMMIERKRILDVR